MPQGAADVLLVDPSDLQVAFMRTHRRTHQYIFVLFPDQSIAFTQVELDAKENVEGLHKLAKEY